MSLIRALSTKTTYNLFKPSGAIAYYSSEIPKNILVEKNHINAQYQQENGKIYDKKPFKITLEANKAYAWCLCGHSKTNPICDGTHKNIHLRLKLKPVRFAVEKSGDYWLCQCKATKNRPFCDGTHKTPEIQEK